MQFHYTPQSPHVSQADQTSMWWDIKPLSRHRDIDFILLCLIQNLCHLLFIDLSIDVISVRFGLWWIGSLSCEQKGLGMRTLRTAISYDDRNEQNMYIVSVSISAFSRHESRHAIEHFTLLLKRQPAIHQIICKPSSAAKLIAYGGVSVSGDRRQCSEKVFFCWHAFRKCREG